MSLEKENTLMDQVILEINTDRKAENLFIDYRVTNRLSKSIYLLNRIFQWTEKGLEIDPNFIYTELIDGKLRLTKAFIPVPDDVLVEIPDVPYLSPVKGGAEFRENLHLKLPLEPFHPYYKVNRSNTVHSFDKAELAIGWLVEGSFDLREGSTPDGEQILAVHHNQAARSQQLLIGEIDKSVTSAFGF